MGASSPEPPFSASTTRNASSPQKPHCEATRRRRALLFGRESTGSALPNPQVHFWGCVFTKILALPVWREEKLIVQQPGIGVSLPVRVNISAQPYQAIGSVCGAAACLYENPCLFSVVNTSPVTCSHRSFSGFYPLLGHFGFIIAGLINFIMRVKVVVFQFVPGSGCL